MQTFDYAPPPPRRDWQIGPKAAVLFMGFVWLLLGGVVFWSAQTLTQLLTPPRHFVEATLRFSSTIVSPTPVVQARERFWRTARLAREATCARLRDRTAIVGLGFGSIDALLTVDSQVDESAAVEAGLQVAAAAMHSPPFANSSLSFGPVGGSEDRYVPAARCIAIGGYLTLTLLAVRRRIRRRRRFLSAGASPNASPPRPMNEAEPRTK